MTDRKESDYTYHVPVGTGLFDAKGVLRPDAILRLATDVADEHVRNFRANNELLAREFGVAWVVLSMEIHWLGEVRQNDVLSAKTWCTGCRHGMYGRDFLFRGEDGREVFGVGSVWTLLDLSERSIYRGEDVQKFMDFRHEPPIYPGKKGRYKTKGYDLAERETLPVRPSWIDGSGHVNNSRYGEFLYDSLSAAMRGRLKDVRQMEFYFHGELSEGDRITLFSWEGENDMLVTGRRDGEETFVAHLLF